MGLPGGISCDYAGPPFRPASGWARPRGRNPIGALGARPPGPACGPLEEAVPVRAPIRTSELVDGTKLRPLSRRERCEEDGLCVEKFGPRVAVNLEVRVTGGWKATDVGVTDHQDLPADRQKTIGTNLVTSPEEASPGGARPVGERPEEACPGGTRPGEACLGRVSPGWARPGGARPEDECPRGARPGEACPGGMRPGWARPGGVLATGQGRVCTRVEACQGKTVPTQVTPASQVSVGQSLAGQESPAHSAPHVPKPTYCAQQVELSEVAYRRPQEGPQCQSRPVVAAPVAGPREPRR
ncbi:uncharacterized protein [Nerophis lumbriciformis]|uniref:uncharacterized protein n=1 Tax=Nerophis lumbriciformis TaxID=546530 RepID=UPI003BAC9712